MNKKRWYQALIVLAPFLLLVDRIGKAYAQSLATERPPIIALIPHLLYFTYFENHNLAFGIPLVAPKVIAVLVGAVFIATLVGLIRAIQKKHLAHCAALTLILAGGVSNLFDRVRFGATLDFLFLPPLSFFNLADTLIIGGIALFTFSRASTPRGAPHSL